MIGTRTWGGEIWLSGVNTLSDGGIARAPMTGVYGPEGDWLIEQVGVIPDIEVDNLPHATFNGRDAQLEAAIAYLERKIAEDPRTVPSAAGVSAQGVHVSGAVTARKASGRSREQPATLARRTRRICCRSPTRTPCGCNRSASRFSARPSRSMDVARHGTSPVTCFVGENGSGKSTLLEAIAIAANLPSAGSVDQARTDPTLQQQGVLARALKLAWRVRTNRGLFLRAEDFFGFQLLLQRERAEFAETLERMEEEYADRSDYAKTLAMGPLQASMADMDRRYGADPDARSHGEAFLNFFQQRLVPQGLYLLDEPEAALSPQRQLALLAMIFDLVAEGAQFIIATHSPLLLAYPGARIYSFDESPIAQVAWDDTEHVRLDA